MCGIWGAVNTADEGIAEIAAQAMHHRGPDDHGCYVSKEKTPVMLVNTRLAIIDLSETGHQPMSTPDGRYWIAYNGEVYNYEDTRALLEEAGHTFKGHSDTEVILHAYQQWGPACLEHFRGMFALAIWDHETQTLFAARDRLGIKPLYFALQENGEDSTLIFGSELKAFLKSGLIDAELNLEALHHYLSFYAVPSPYTMLKGVEMLPPGHFLTFHKGQIDIKKYWSLPANQPLDMDETEIRDELRRLLEESIRLRMIADVPVGAFLSGGLDSSAVVALMTRISGSRLRTFSIGFGAEGQRIDEREDARLLAEHYNTEHTEVVISGRDVRDQIDAIVEAMDMPTGDGLNTYFVSQATGQHLKVALSGLGGDEIFAGYPQFRMFKRADQATGVWNKLPGAARAATRGAASVAAPLQRALTWLDGDTLRRYERVRILFGEDRKEALYTTDIRTSQMGYDSSLDYLGRHVHPDESDTIARLTRLELQNYMAHTLLRDTDAMSMAHSLEVRVPLIDHELVEFATRIPADLKLREGRSKWIFAQALQDVLPTDILDRPKRGFEMPVKAWMQNDLSDVLDDVFSGDSIRRRGIFDVDAMQNIYTDFKGGQTPYMYTWSLAVLELWMRHFIDQPLAVAS